MSELGSAISLVEEFVTCSKFLRDVRNLLGLCSGDARRLVQGRGGEGEAGKLSRTGYRSDHLMISRSVRLK